MRHLDDDSPTVWDEFDLSHLPPHQAAIMSLCLRLVATGLIGRSDDALILDTPRTVYSYVCAAENFLAIELLLVSIAPASAFPLAERRALIELLRDLSYEFWAQPSEAEAWVDARLGQPAR